MAVSLTLQRANELLLQRQVQARQNRIEAGLSTPTGISPKGGKAAVSLETPVSFNHASKTAVVHRTAVFSPPPFPPSQGNFQATSVAPAGTEATPSPLWGRENVISYLKLRRQKAGLVDKPKVRKTAVSQLSEVDLKADPKTKKTAEVGETAVRVFPSFAAAILDKKCLANGYAVDAATRLYLTLKTIDTIEHDGRGWLSWAEAAQKITDKKSSFHLYGKRQFKTVLNRGEGVFWERVTRGQETRIRLVSRARSAAAVGIDHLSGRETAVPLKAILGLLDVRTNETAVDVDGRARMANFRAAMYAIVHGGRRHDEQEKPISRQTMETNFNVSSYRQRSYAARTGIKTKRNILPICDYSKESLTAVRLVDGIPAYKHFDHFGILGPRGAVYVAQMLPNTYIPPSFVSQQKRNRTRKANMRLAGLCIMNGADSSSDYRRVFHRNATEAVKTAAKNDDQDSFAQLTIKTTVGVWKNFQYRQEWVQ